MMPRELAYFAGLIALSVATCCKADELTMPYFDRGACPFECCTYREWTATHDTPLRKEAADDSPIVSVVKVQEHVRGLTGVVITTKPGIVIVLKPIKLYTDDEQEVSLVKGDVAYYLHYMGAGYDKYWFRGQLLAGQTSITKVGNNGWIEVRSMPEWTWWAYIQRSNGDKGWSRDLGNFAHIDACE